MRIKWFGHACFGIESKTGTRIVTDPFDESVGYGLPNVEADIVTTSHDHYDHNNTATVGGTFRHIGTPGDFNVSGTNIKGFSTFHDDAGGSIRGRNVMFVFNVDGLAVCHCGDLGHLPGRELAGELMGMDVLMVPVGGKYTIDARGAAELIRLLKPRITIPMHYMTNALSFTIDGVDSFLKLIGASGTEPVNMLEIDKSNIDSLSPIVVMNYE